MTGRRRLARLAELVGDRPAPAPQGMLAWVNVLFSCSIDTGSGAVAPVTLLPGCTVSPSSVTLRRCTGSPPVSRPRRRAARYLGHPRTCEGVQCRATPGAPVWSSSSHRRRPRRSRAISARGTSWRPAWATSVTCRATPPTCRPNTRSEPWARLGVDVDNGFAALYVVSADRKQQITKLTKLAKEVDEVFLATDEDREGEAIAWHLVETLKPKVPVKRMVFHEITRPAIQAAVANPREIDRDLVDAQEARRILDRLYGYEVSPVLWKKVMPRLSAGRVQSVATRIVVERERQRMAFRTADYWDIQATLAVDAAAAKEGPRTFNATLVALDGDRIATGKDFEPTTGQVRPGAARRAPRRGRRPRAGRPPRRAAVHGHPGRGEALPAPAVRAVHHLDAPAGGRAQAALLVTADDAHRAAAVRERLHHLYAYRLGQPVGDRHRRRPPADRRALRRGQRPAGAAPLHRQGQERPGGARGDPPRGRPASARPARSPRSSPPRSSSSTS